MKTATVIIACLALGLPCLPGAVVHAADEDTQASVYLVFDPETGEFIEVEEGGGSSQHEPVASDDGNGSAAETAGAANPPLTWVAGAAVIVLLGGAAFAWRRRGQAPRT